MVERAASPPLTPRSAAARPAAAALGGCCALCGRASCRLEIDHVDVRGWDPSKLSRWSRVARYWHEHQAGVRLRALYRSCDDRYRPPRPSRAEVAYDEQLAFHEEPPC